MSYKDRAFIMTDAVNGIRMVLGERVSMNILLNYMFGMQYWILTLYVQKVYLTRKSKTLQLCQKATILKCLLREKVRIHGWM
jgi:hypothetical protein